MHCREHRGAARPIAATLLVAMGVLVGVLAAAGAPASAADALELELLQLTNQARATAGVAPLQMLESFNNVAEGWSAQMASVGSLSHRPDLPSQVAPFAPNWTRLGENVGVGGSLAAIQNAFMSSSGHRDNILNASYNLIGIGVVQSGSSLWVTVNFMAHALPLPGAGPTVPSDQVLPLRPDGTLSSPPDLTGVRGSGRLDTAVKGTDGSIYWSGNSGSGFGGWWSIGSPSVGVVGEPSIVSWTPGRIDVFVRGGDDRLWQRFTTDAGANWSTWFQPLGASGLLAAAPEASSWGPGRLDITVLGSDGRVYQRFYENGWNGSWIDHGAPPAGAVGAPTAAGWSPGRMDLFVRGGDNRLWQRFWDGRGWSAWIRPPGDTGTLASSPSATSSAPGRISIVTRGTDNGVYAQTFAGSWVGWRRVGGSGDVVVDRPAAASRSYGELDIAGMGSDARAYLFITQG